MLSRMVAASAALTLSGMPFMGPIGAARVGYIDGEYKLNPPIDEMPNSALELVVAGTDDAVMMVESEAKELSEEIMLGAVMFGHREMQNAIEAIIRLAEKAAKEPRDVEVPTYDAEAKLLAGRAETGLREAYQIAEKAARRGRIDEIKSEAVAALVGEEDGKIADKTFGKLFKALESSVMRNAVIDTGRRIDGRDLKTVRPISGRSAFSRARMAARCSPAAKRKLSSSLRSAPAKTSSSSTRSRAPYKQHFMLHYNFPPYSVGEVGRMMGAGRREIGHGKLAWRAINPLLPDKAAFPYTIRVVSEITESNGSSSMATVCGGSLALMDAGVPLQRAVAGIAMGLILEGKKFAVLSDILGDEDHLGDMDFKVAGTETGVTSLQMDIKITGITEEIMSVALNQARDGRMHILGEMAKAIGTARAELGEHAPRIETIKIPTDKIREVIGSGGKVIREIVEKTGAKIDISDDGTIKVASADGESIRAALKWIKGIVAEPEVGEIYEGKIVKIMDFGAFVNFFGPRDGLVHISELASKRVAKVSDVVKEGDMVKVKLIGIDDRGKVRLSMKVVDQATGKEIVSEGTKEQQPAQ